MHAFQNDFTLECGFAAQFGHRSTNGSNQMGINTAAQSWSISEALSEAYRAFAQRFGADLLWQAFEALTTKREDTMAAHQALERDLDQYLWHALNAQGANLVIWMANARSKPDNADLLLHCAVRWWLARDDLHRKPAGTRVPCEYAPGSTDHSALQLLTQALYRGSAPDTEPPAAGPAPRTQR